MILLDDEQKAFEIPGPENFQFSSDVNFCTKGKRPFDLIVASLCLLAVLPLGFLIFLLIKLDSKGDAFFKQKRLGKDGKPFTIYKFRTMHAQKCHTLGGAQAKQNDPRVTRVGRWLRRSSLDELPQLLNVLRGEMSLVGPRPHAVEHDLYFAQHVPLYWKRYAVKPGLTGWAQIKGFRGATPEINYMKDRVAWDLDYISKRTWWMDVWIILKTLPALVFPPQMLH